MNASSFTLLCIAMSSLTVVIQHLANRETKSVGGAMLFLLAVFFLPSSRSITVIASDHLLACFDTQVSLNL